MIAQVYLRRGKEESLLRRHPWIFSGALKNGDAAFAPGETVLVCDHKGQALAVAAEISQMRFSRPSLQLKEPRS